MREKIRRNELKNRAGGIKTAFPRVGTCMPDHPIKELKDMRGELHANPHTRLAIALTAVVAVIALLVFLVVLPLLRAPAIPPDPVAQGASRAFGVAEPPTDAVPADDAYRAGNPPPAAAPDIPPADLGATGGEGGASSGEPPVVYAPAAP